ncbi:carbohydrate kinase family protein [Candidatus Woesearchaeota archaeon]|nr:carbohydrate kinase family protein [Candidatus Woesearchaeota archaeon]
MFDVITIGGATVDLFLKTKANVLDVESHGHIEHMLAYPSGRKILVEHMIYMTGGGATNTAVAFARLGLKTGSVCKIGEDLYGKQILNEFKKEKISFLGKQSEIETGTAIILDTVDHDRTILVCKGANDYLSMKDINKKKIKSQWYYIATLLHESYKTCEALAVSAERNNILIAFNPSNYLAQKGAHYLHPILSRTKMLFVNREEAALLLRVGLNFDINYLLEKCNLLIHEQGIVVITDGKNGAYCYDGNLRYSIKPRKIKVVETTGAGDAFTASFLAGFIKTNDIEFSLKLAQINAESVVQYYGAKNILLKWKDAMKLMKKYSHKVEKVAL